MSVDDVKHLFRTRIWWRRIAIGVSCCVIGYVIDCVPGIQRFGTVGLAPSIGLIAWTAKFEPPAWVQGKRNKPSDAANELARRVRAGQLWDWETRLMLDWNRTIGVPRAWPDGRTFIVQYENSWLWDHGVLIGIAVGNQRGLASKTDTLYVCDPLDPGAGGVTIRFCVASGKAVEFAKWYPVQHVARADECLDVYEGSEADAAVRSVFTLDANVFDSAVSLIGIEVVRDHGSIPNDVALGFEVTILDRGVPVGTWTCSPLWMRGLLDEKSPFMNDLVWSSGVPEDFVNWTVRVRSSADAAILDAGKARYWRGDFEVPLAEVFPQLTSEITFRP